jgi:hypothetical protein
MTFAKDFQLTVAQARAALGALRSVVEADGAPSTHGARLLEVAADSLELGDDWRRLPPMGAAPVGEVFPTLEARRALVDVLIVAACIEGEVTSNGEAAVRKLATALSVRSPWVDLLPALRRRQVFAVKRQLVRRSPDGRRILARTWAEDGLLGVWRALRFVLGVHQDPALATRFRAMRALPEGTVGRTFFDDFQARKLALPGERGGMPERMVHHDLMHVVNRYGTDAAGECELAGFYCGSTKGDAFTFIVIVLATFHLGMAVSPSVVTPARLAFDPARVLAAFLRGRRLRVDVMGPWDYWTILPLSIEEAQERLGIGQSPGKPTQVPA